MALKVSRLNAVVYFRQSLSVRDRQATGVNAADTSHQRMVQQMRRCIERIEAMNHASFVRTVGMETKKTPATAAGGNLYAVLAGSDPEVDGDDMEVDD